MAGGRGTSLRRYALTRLALVIPMIFIVLTLVFLLMRVAPGDPITASLGGHVPPEVVNRIKDELGYDKPILVQYREYLGSIARGDFGTTITDRRSVGEIIVVNGAATLELTFYAMIVAIVVGVAFGMLAGRYRDTWIDGGSRLFGILIYATPVFFLGLMAQLFFGSYLGWLPTSDRASPLVDATPRGGALRRADRQRAAAAALARAGLLVVDLGRPSDVAAVVTALGARRGARPEVVSEAARLLKMKRSRLSQIVNAEPQLRALCGGTVEDEPAEADDDDESGPGLASPTRRPAGRE